MSRAADVGRRRRLHRISADGVFALVAVDNREPLRIAFEAEIVAALAPVATGFVIDVEHGATVLAGGVPAVVMPIEGQGHADAESGRVTSFLPGWGPGAALAAGADACKLLLPFRADLAASAGAQIEVVSAAVAGCHEAGLPFLLEPVVHRLPDEDEAAHAEAFPGLVMAGLERLVPLGADIMNVQFPNRRAPPAPRRSGAVRSTARAARRRGCSGAAGPRTRRSRPGSRPPAGPERRATSPAARPGRGR